MVAIAAGQCRISRHSVDDSRSKNSSTTGSAAAVTRGLAQQQRVRAVTDVGGGYRVSEEDIAQFIREGTVTSEGLARSKRHYKSDQTFYEELRRHVREYAPTAAKINVPVLSRTSLNEIVSKVKPMPVFGTFLRDVLAASGGPTGLRDCFHSVSRDPARLAAPSRPIRMSPFRHGSRSSTRARTSPGRRTSSKSKTSARTSAPPVVSLWIAPRAWSWRFVTLATGCRRTSG